ncbi:MAG TPA: hypothetical protein PLJ52_05115 [Tenuifilaceae bacterium]|nr:hypothetical protein [Tenuifilaceae bacterium]
MAVILKDDIMSLFNFNKRNPEIIVSSISVKIRIDDSPILKWIDFNEDQKAELFFFHITYGWLFMQDYKLIEGKSDNIYLYAKYCFIEMMKIIPNLDFEYFFELFINRFQNHRDELSKVRGSSIDSMERFPEYFFTQILYHPLMAIPNDDTIFEYEKWSQMELADMYAHQVNFIEKKLKN